MTKIGEPVCPNCGHVVGVNWTGFEDIGNRDLPKITITGFVADAEAIARVIEAKMAHLIPPDPHLKG